VTGGSGMFIDALIDGLHPSPSDPKVREKLHQEWNQKGMTPLLEELKTKDPETHTKIDTSNPMRVLRALEIIRVSGQTLEEIRKEPKDGIEYPVKRFCISWKREDLYERINLRVDQMIHDGLLDEVKKLPIKENLLLQNTVGYKEWISYFDKEASLDQTIALIQKNSRNYAKRQETWLKRYDDLICLNPYDSISLKNQVFSHLDKTT
jgi:tRNA dimethylallyltransferase